MWIDQMNEFGLAGTPFLFIIDYDMKNAFIQPLHEVDITEIQYQVDRHTNFNRELNPSETKSITITRKQIIPYQDYLNAFDFVVKNQNLGYSYLLNLTFPTQIELDASLEEVFVSSRAKYKLLFRDLFVVFSPESFIQIEDNIISSYPMKGTIDADIPHAEQIITHDTKETAEHATIVDLIRNDMSMVAQNVRVEDYRYIEKIRTNNKDLLQVSSKISGHINKEYKQKFGDIFKELLPAGSISGAPKNKTLELIKEAEGYERGYYTGVFGVFDGEKLDSAVMIRYIEQVGGNYYFKSGGGITTMSKPEDEYNELINKIYVPIG